MKFGIFFATAAAATLFANGGPLLAAAPLTAAPAAVVAQLAAMDDADCASSKSADWGAYEKTLASEYVEIDADESKTGKPAVVSGLAEPSADRVTSCSTVVTATLTDGTKYYVFGTYTEGGTKGAKKVPYRSVEQFRDTWKRAGGAWLQTESMAYDMTLTNLTTGKVVVHQVLPKSARTPPLAP